MGNHLNEGFENKKGISVTVRGDNIDQAIRVIGKKMKAEGVLREVRARQAYEQPSVKRRRKAAEAKVRWAKALRKQHEAEIGIVATKDKPKPKARATT